ncbi:MAG: hypothetical protein PVF96_07275 [Candidatus Bathyarchaeota archaeon]
MDLRKAGRKNLPRYVVFTETELLSLIICIILDVSEYMAAVLLLPLIGDFLDIVGFVACLAMFRLIGFMSLLELVPGLDILPIFIITWLVWYLVRKRKGLI